MEIIYHINIMGVKIIQIPINFRDRVSGKSKLKIEIF